MKKHSFSKFVFIGVFMLFFIAGLSIDTSIILIIIVAAMYAAIPSSVIFLLEILIKPKEKQDISLDSHRHSNDNAENAKPVYNTNTTPSAEDFKSARTKYLEMQKDIARADWEELNSLHRFPISLSGVKTKIQSTSFLKALTYSNITAKSNLSKLGKFVVVDIETTGLSMTKNDVIEIAAIKYVDFEPVEIFETYIKPVHGINAEAMSVNNISEDMVSDAPLLYQVIPSLQEFISGFNLVAHNLEFDFKFLCRAGLDIVSEKRKYYDTLKIAQKMLKKPKVKYDKEYEEYLPDYDSDYDVEDHKLETLCDYYSIYRNDGHRALSDCYDTARLFKKLAEEKIE